MAGAWTDLVIPQKGSPEGDSWGEQENKRAEVQSKEAMPLGSDCYTDTHSSGNHYLLDEFSLHSFWLSVFY